MIEHTVTFSLKHPPKSDAETAFLGAANKLAAIPGVRDYLIRQQLSAKNSHTFGISMRFESQAEFDAYLAHPMHMAFVEERWLQEVESFQEADFVALDSE